jgi:hypothetical protein
MSNNGSLSVNYKIDGNNITFKDVEVFSSRPIDFSHPLALGTSRMASIRLKENNINDDNDKELGIAKKFLQGKQLSSNFDFTKDGLPVAEASVVDESIQEAEAVSDEDEDEDEDEDGKLQFKNEGTIAEGEPQYPEGEAGTEVNEEPQPQPQSNSLLGNIGSAIGNVASTTGNALGSAVSTTGNALGSAVSTTGNAIESVASTTGDALGITKNNQAASPATTGETLNGKPTPEISLAPMGIQNRPSPEPAGADSDNTNPSVTEQIKKQSALERLRSQKTDYAAPKTFWSKFGGKRTKRNLGKMARNKQTKKGGKQNRTKRNNKGKRKTVKQ